MGKIIVIPSSMEMIKDLVNDVDGYIIGINDLAVNLPCTFSINEAIKIIEYLNINKKSIFISLNKNMRNSDLELLKSTLLTLNDYNIDGVMYYDISIVNLKRKLKLKYDLVWSQEHLATNSLTTDYWYQRGAKYVYLSSEITRREVEEISTSTKSKVMVNLFGYLPIFTSGRHLVDNYLKTFNNDKVDDLYYMNKEGNTYPITDTSDGTVTYSAYVLNGIKDYDIKASYIVLNSFLINDMKTIVKLFNSVNSKNVNEYDKQINELIQNKSDGFLHKETIYKVK